MPRRYLTLLRGDDDGDTAIGLYRFDGETLQLGDGRIVLSSTEASAVGASGSLYVHGGKGLGVFAVPDAQDLGVDLDAFTSGGLRFQNFLDGQPATLADELAPLVTDAAGRLLPLSIFHSLGGTPDDGFNHLNPAAGLQAIQLDLPIADRLERDGLDIELLAFEDERVTSPDYGGLFDDVVVAISDAPLTGATLEALVGAVERAYDAPMIA